MSYAACGAFANVCRPDRVKTTPKEMAKPQGIFHGRQGLRFVASGKAYTVPTHALKAKGHSLQSGLLLVFAGGL
ncbi:hypothetical protein GCM10010971_16770 [Silvimonas amylolytica]|uniref:Uncharacterized protein n=1 Tax=Silvimonas amylolytica TaxID=449663 RepID=A0ABQ2PJS6_9NEIS|nr:hypothetical protein GCM10010971_16770 [Silvimonas amylolytica]